MERSEEEKQTRRLQLSGGSTFIISLPKNWIDDFKLNVGENVTIIKNSNRSITLFPGDSQQSQEKTHAEILTSQKDTSESIRRKIIATYLGGYKTIQIKSKGMRIQPEHTKVIRELVRTSMIGTEIVESSSESIIIQILTRLPELSFETALRRMYLMASNMHREAIESLSTGDISHADEVVRMDDEVDRFSLYMRRNLTLAVQNANVLLDMGLQRPSDCLGYRAVIGRIERVADHASLIAKRVKFLDGMIESKLIKKISKISDNSLLVFENAITALIKRDFELAEKVAEDIKKVIEEEKKFMSGIKESTKNSTVIRFVLEDIRRTAEYSSDIAEVAIDENIGNIINKK